MRRHCHLTRAVLASTFFVAPLLYADTTVNGVNTSTAGPFIPPLVTSVAGNIEILTTGKVNAAAVDGIKVNDANRFILLDPGNTTAGNEAITTTAPGNGINIVAGGTTASIVIGAGTKINAGGTGLLIQDTGAVVLNSGTIGGVTGSGVHIAAGGTNTQFNNAAGGVIQSQSAGTQTFLVSDTGSNILNSGSIFGTPFALAALRYDASFTLLTNAATGIIDGTASNASAINIAGATTGDIVNNGLINSFDDPGGLSTIVLGALYTGNITNSSTGILRTRAGTNLNINGPFGSITNAGLIESTAAGGKTIVIGPIVGGGTITNSGIIQSINTPTINIGGSFNQLNNSGSIISTMDVPIQVSAPNITVPGGIINSGNITAPAFGIAVNLFNGFAGVDIHFVQNAGTVTGTIFLDSAGNTANGVPFTMTGGTINGSVIANGAVSDTLNISGGTITGTVQLFDNNDTLNLSGGKLGNVLGGTGNDTYNISGGSLTNLFEFGGVNTVNLSGGVVTGDIDFSFLGNGPGDIFNLSGGAVLGTTQLGNLGDIVNLSGTSLQALEGGAGADTFNVTGGSFTSLDGNGGADILNINATFTANGTINAIPTINVNNAGTVFTVNNTITNMTNKLTTAAGTAIVFGVNNLALGGGAIQNNGALQINNGVTVDDGAGAVTNNGSVTIYTNGLLKAGSYVQNAGSNFAMQIQNPDYGKIQVTGNANLKAGSFVSPFLAPGNFIVAGSTFDIVQAALGGVTDNSTLIQPSSPIIFFQKSGPIGVVCNGGANSCVELTAQRNPFISAALTDNALEVAIILDSLIPFFPFIDPDLLAVMGQLDFLSSTIDISAALESLAPPINYSIVMGSHVSMDNAFDSVQHRLEDLRGLGPLTLEAELKTCRDRELYNGVCEMETRSYGVRKAGCNYGDINDIYGGRGFFGAWAKIYGNQLDQRKRHQIDGYLGNATGLALGGDWRITDTAAFGVGLSYTKENSTDKTPAENKVGIKSFQSTFYGWYEPYDSVYVDSMVGVASHKYNTTRFINIGTLSRIATAQFYGIHYGFQTDVGYVFLTSDDFYVAPFARAKITYLDIDNYTEEGAGGLNLSVHNDPLDETIFGIGLRLAMKRDYVQAIYVPEVSALLAYDFSGSAQEMMSNFLGGGNPFYTTSIRPAQLIQIYGLSVNAHTSDGYTATVKFNFEYRDHFFGYNGYFQLHYTWT